MNTPFVSFCILTYNQENFIRDAILGAIEQNYPNMEIIISDDCSTDRTYDVINETVKSLKNTHNHKIIVNRNPENLGIAEHCNKVMYEIAKGELLVMAGGDDVSLPTRVSEAVACFEKYPEITSLSFSSEQVDVNLDHLEKQEPIISPDTVSILTLEDYCRFNNFIIFSGDSRVLRRSVIEKFPPINIASAEDIFLFIRSLMLGSIAYIRKPLVKRRIHGSNVSTSKFNKARWERSRDQMIFDVEYAKKNNIIDDIQYSAIKTKVENISRLFYKQGKRRNLILKYPYIYKLYRFLKTHYHG